MFGDVTALTQYRVAGLCLVSDLPTEVCLELSNAFAAVFLIGVIALRSMSMFV